MSNRELKLRTNLGNKTKKRQLSEKRSRRARGLRALNLPTTVTGSLKTAENGSLSNDGHRLNNSIPINLLFVTGTLLLLARITRKRQYVLLLPLLFGPTSCLVGWYLTENMSDPNWFHLFAITTIGMFVSCAVTALLSIVSRKTESIDAQKVTDGLF